MIDINKYIKSDVLSNSSLNEVHGYMMLIDNKPFVGSDGKIIYNTKSTLQANFRWAIRHKLFDEMLDNGDVPKDPNNNSPYSRYPQYQGYMSSWRFYQTSEFKSAWRKLLKEWQASGRLKIIYK